MKRSGDVTAAAVVLFCGSGALALFAAGDSLYMARSYTEVHWPRILLVFGLLIAWGTATAAGILKLRGWARISIIVMSAGAILFCFIAAVAVAIAALGGTGSLAADVGAFFAVTCAIPLGISVWWLVLFTRKRVAAEFAGGRVSGEVSVEAIVAPAPSAFPARVAVVALWFFLGALVDFHAIFFRPLSTILLTVLGVHLLRYAAVCAFIVMMQLRTVIGIGLFYRARWAQVAGIALCIYFAVNSIVAFAVPGSLNRFAIWVRSLEGQDGRLSSGSISYLSHLHVLALVVEVLVPVVALYFLWSSKAAFYAPPRTPGLGATRSVPGGSGP